LDELQVLDRLRDLASDAERAAADEETAIARRASAAGRLQSGYFYKTVQTDLQERFGLAIRSMAHFAAEATSKKQAARALNIAGAELRGLMMDRLRRTCAGSANGAVLSAVASKGVLDETSENLTRQLRHQVSDLRNGIGAEHTSWLGRHGWQAISAVLASASLVLGWLALK
jgi:hypothetical protein